MADDFTLEPDEIEPDRPALRPVRLVATGLAPTAELPRSPRKKPERPPVYVPCPTCGGMVLTGETPAGGLLCLDTQIPTYTALWLPETPRPLLQVSRAYPVHRCVPGAGVTPMSTDCERS